MKRIIPTKLRLNWQLLVAAVLVLQFGLASPIASALSTQQQTLYRSGVFSYDAVVGAGGCSGPSELIGSDNAEKVYNYFIGKGLTPIQAVGIMGNLKAESNFDPGIEEIGNGIGYGIAQWSFERRTALENAAEKQGVPVNDLGFQLEFLYNESNERTSLWYPDIKEWEGLKRQDNVKDAVTYWEDNFERPAVAGQQIRIDFANELLNQFGSSGGDGQTGDIAECSIGPDGNPKSGTSLPVDERWYEENPNWFSKAHHSGYAASDIPVPSGTPVYSMINGTVTRAPIKSDDTSYGQGVWIKSANGIEIIYAHGLDGGKVDGVTVGSQVEAGQLIMHSGSTGNSTGPHLHLEVRIGGTPVCPQTWFTSIVKGSPLDPTTLPSSGCTY